MQEHYILRGVLERFWRVVGTVWGYPKRDGTINEKLRGALSTSTLARFGTSGRAVWEAGTLWINFKSSFWYSICTKQQSY